MPEPKPPVSIQADEQLKKLLADLPSTGRGIVTATVTNDGAQIDFATKINSHFTSSAYWQKPRTGAATWGARATVQW
jgi:hypothetical protein